MRKTLRNDRIRYKVETVQVHEAATTIQCLNMFYEENEILAYLRKHPGVALLYRFDKGWILSKNVDASFAGHSLSPFMTVCILHDNKLVLIKMPAKTCAMDVYFYLEKMSE